MNKLRYMSSRLVSLTIILSVIIGNSLMGLSDTQKENLGPILGNNRLNPQSSTNSSAPVLLAVDSPLNDTYPSATDYYYRTDSQAAASYYHVFWVQPAYSSWDHDLYVYSESSYSALLNTSTGSAGQLNWVIGRPLWDRYYYPRLHTAQGGYGYITWVNSSSKHIHLDQSTQSGTLDSDICMDIYQVTLTSGSACSFLLRVPMGCDFNFYLYHLDIGDTVGRTFYLRSSESIIAGTDEYISGFVPAVNDTYLLVVARKSGSGTYSLQGYNYSLTDDTPLSGSYTEYMSYYHRTGNASASQYQVVWLKPVLATRNFDLYLYSDSAYSTLLASSTRSSGLLEWVVMCPNTSRSYYVKVNAIPGSSGDGWLEWEGSDVIARSTIYSESLTVAESIELYQTYLSADVRYQFTLSLPAWCDFDLYIYHLSADNITNTLGSIISSTNVGNGINESIVDFQPLVSDYYAIVVARVSGDGSYEFSFDYYQPPSIDGFSISAVLLAIITILFAIGIIHRKELLKSIRFPERI